MPEETILDFSDAFTGDTQPTEEPQTEPKAEPKEEPKAEPKEEPKEADTTPKYTIKHLGKEHTVSLDELQTLAQKGMDYDFVRQERDALKPEVSILDKFAKASGMTREQYIKACEEQLLKQQTDAELKRPPEDIARENIELRREKELTAIKAAQAEQRRKQEQALYDFVKEYPDVKEFPPEVVERITKGEDPITAYRAFENQKLKQELEALKKSMDNKGRAVGSAQSSAAKEEEDQFLAGFMGAFK